jgi:hypothetical protein
MIIDADTGEKVSLDNCEPPTPQELAERESKRADQGILEGWCPGGRLSDGICNPTNNTRSDWMARYGGARVLPVGELILLGTHNSGFDKHAPQTPSMETCQNVGVEHQLAWGVRVLDLRVQFFRGASGPKRFAIYHDTCNGRYVETDILQPLLRYRSVHGAYREIVILDFHQFKDFTPAAHAEFCEMIKRTLGSSIIPPAWSPAAVVQLWELNKNTIIAYNANERDGIFWGGVEQRWIGENTPSKDEMKAFLARVGDEPKTLGNLRSVQAAYYSLPFFTPKDLSEDLMSWFATTDEGGPIAGHYIINTDWSLRSRLADNIIHANAIRARARGAHVIASSPNTSGPVIQTMSYGIYSVGNGDWAPSLSFGANTSGYTSIQLIVHDADWACQLEYGGQTLDVQKGDRFLFRIMPNQVPIVIARLNGL